jgi:hypothetical protein
VPETSPSVTYTPAGAWVKSSPASIYTGQRVFSSATAGARATLTFTGTSVRWIGQRGRDMGIAHVYVDGTLVGQIDTFVSANSQERFQAPVFTATGLGAGTHTVTIKVTGLKNPASGGTLIVVDGFDVY